MQIHTITDQSGAAFWQRCCCAILLSVLFPLVAFSQYNTEIKITSVWGKETLILEKKYPLTTENDSVQINQFKCYISNIQLKHKGRIVYNEPNSYHLIDVENSQSLALTLAASAGIPFDTLLFNLGIDSATNTLGALGGELDPAKGMYWTWQSGYINVKLEGKSALCKTRNQEFQFHLGGYLNPGYALQKIALAANGAPVNCSINLSELFLAINLSENNQVMSPSEKAVWLSQQLAKSIQIAK